MRNCIITLFLLHFAFSGISQSFMHEVRSVSKRPIVQERLSEIRTLSDFSEGFPTSWIGEYQSVLISATCNGRAMEALSTNDTLSNIQMSLLRKADLGTNILVEVRYYPTQTLKMPEDVKMMNFSYTVAPALEAQYLGGYESLNLYIKEKAIANIPESIAKQMEVTKLRFTINENGQVVNAHLQLSSFDAAIDRMLLDTINNMPKWTPAENGSGIKVSQDFELILGNMGC